MRKEYAEKNVEVKRNGGEGEVERLRAATNERKIELEERKVAAEELKMMEEKALKFMFTS